MPWAEYQNKRANEDIMKEWWTMWPDANIGVVTGEISGIIAFDIDAKNNRTPEEFDLPITAISRTGGGGWHYIFKHPGYYVKSLNGKLFGPGVDMKADGGFIVVPPSDHQSGNKYAWINEPTTENIAVMPEWLEERIKENERTGSTTYGERLDIKQFVGVSHGSRNEEIHRLACLLYSKGYADADVAFIVSALNKTFIPPLGEGQKDKSDEIGNALRSAKSFIASAKKKEIEKSSTSQAIIVSFSDIKSEQINWLWPERIALGKLTLIVGDPGIGKSLISIVIATTISKEGLLWPVDKTSAPTGDTIFLSAEDDPADTIKPRLDAAGADCSHVHVLKAIQTETTDSDGKKKQRMFSLKNDVPILEKVLINLPNCKMIVVDPISAYLDGTESHANADVRGLLAPLSDLAARYRVAIVAISHLTKDDKKSAMYRALGSIAFVAAARSVYLVTKDKESKAEPQRILVLPLKNNIAKVKTGLAYSVIDNGNGAPVMLWEPEPVDQRADDILAASQENSGNSDREWAIVFLKDFLMDGPKPALEVRKGAKEAGIGDKALRRACGELDVQPKKSSYSGGWLWALPLSEHVQECQDVPLIIEDNLDAFDNVGLLKEQDNHTEQNLLI